MIAAEQAEARRAATAQQAGREFAGETGLGEAEVIVLVFLGIITFGVVPILYGIAKLVGRIWERAGLKAKAASDDPKDIVEAANCRFEDIRDMASQNIRNIQDPVRLIAILKLIALDSVISNRDFVREFMGRLVVMSVFVIEEVTNDAGNVFGRDMVRANGVLSKDDIEEFVEQINSSQDAEALLNFIFRTRVKVPFEARD